MVTSILPVFQAQPSSPDAESVVITIWMALIILGIIGVFVCGFTAKKINNIHNPTYGKAFLAQMFVGAFSLAGFFVFGLFLKAPVPVALGLSYAIIPIIVYRIVFGCLWTEALIIWFVTTAVQAAVGWGLILAGMLSLAAITGG